VISSPDLIAYTGAATAVLAGLIAFTQFDIKKVLAYSTVSQLGFMIAAAGMGAYVAAMFHLITHAFFKALLFLGSGSVIHGMEHGHHHVEEHGRHGHRAPKPGKNSPHVVPEKKHHPDEVLRFNPQDMRNMGGLATKMRTTFYVYMIGAIALAGLPIFAGFWSKDEILLHANQNNLPIYVMLTVAAVFTAFYMGRQLRMVFFGQPRTEAASHASESPAIMTIPLMVLAGLSILGGFLNLPYLSAAAAEAHHNHPEGVYLMLEAWLEHSIAAFHLSEAGLVHLPHIEPLALDWGVAGISTLLALASLGLAMFVVYARRPRKVDEPDPLVRVPFIWWFRILPFDTLYMRGVVPLFNRMAAFLAYVVDWAFWHDFVHDTVIRDGFIGLARFTSQVVDLRGLDGTLVNGSARLASRLAELIRTTQTGFVRSYALAVLLGVVFILAYFVFMAG
jgi:NADH-quinone oxidoreductase subunit L